MISKKKENLLSLSLLFVGLIWGFGFIAVQLAMDAGMSPITNNLLRFGMATILTMIVFRKDVFAIKFADLKIGFFPSVMLALGFFLQNTGMKMTTPGNSALITGSYIVLVPFISFLITKVRPNRNAFIAALVTFAGIAILSLPSFSVGKFRVGDLLVFLSAIAFAMHFIFLDKALKKVNSNKMTFIQVMFTTALFAIMFVCFDTKNFAGIDWKKAILPVLFSGIFSSFLAYCLQTYAQKYISATKVAILMASESLFGAVLSIALGFEPLTVNFFIGGIVAFGGIILAQIPTKNKGEKTIIKDETIADNNSSEKIVEENVPATKVEIK
ncbi:MAG: DMT family transporter [Clostridia bacterium]